MSNTKLAITVRCWQPRNCHHEYWRQYAGTEMTHKTKLTLSLGAGAAAPLSLSLSRKNKLPRACFSASGVWSWRKISHAILWAWKPFQHLASWDMIYKIYTQIIAAQWWWKKTTTKLEWRLEVAGACFFTPFRSFFSLLRVSPFAVFSLFISSYLLFQVYNTSGRRKSHVKCSAVQRSVISLHRTRLDFSVLVKIYESIESTL